jgi:acetyl esterase
VAIFASQGIEQGAELDAVARNAFEQIALLAQGLTAADLTVDIRRDLMRSAMASLHAQKRWPTQSQTLHIELTQRSLPARLYSPQELRSDMLIVYFHGGGWVVGDLETHNTNCELLSHLLGCKLLSVQYRKAPEHVFPAPCEDAIDALAWAGSQKAQWDCKRLVVCGDSAGGHLAAVAMHTHCAQGTLKIAGALLFYPVTDMQFLNRSYRERGQGPGLTAESMCWFWQQFLCPDLPIAQIKPSLDERAVPMLQRWAAPPPPTVILAAWHDPLYDEAVQYAQLLQKAGGQVVLQSAPDMPHGFLHFPGISPSAYAHVLAASNALTSMLAED